MKSGLRDRIGNAARYGLDKCPVHALELTFFKGCKCRFAAGFENGRTRRVLHALDIAVDFLCLNAFQVVTDGHVEHKRVRIAEPEFHCNQLTNEPAFYILFKSFFHRQFRGPLAVIALIACRDTGLRDTGGKFAPIHFLHGLQFKKSGARGIGSDDILGELGIRPCSRSEGRFDLPVKNGQRGLSGQFYDFGHTEDAALFPVFFQNSPEQLFDRDRSHDITHSHTSFFKV